MSSANRDVRSQTLAMLHQLTRPRVRSGQVELVWVGGRHIGHVCDAISRHRLVERGWTVQQVLDRVDREQRTLRRDVDPTAQRDPLAWLFWLIGRAIDADELSPRAAAAAEHAQIDAILADMHRRYPQS